MDIERVSQSTCHPSSHVEGRYANYLEVGINASEFVVDFGQHYADDARARLHTRIVTAPQHMKAFIDLLQSCLRDYEARYGTLVERHDMQEGAR